MPRRFENCPDRGANTFRFIHEAQAGSILQHHNRNSTRCRLGRGPFTLKGLCDIIVGAMRKRPSAVPLALVTIIALTNLTTAEAREPEVKGDRLEFTLSDLDGNIVKSSDARFGNKVVLVTLWGTWCTPCRSETPTFNDLQDRYGDDGLVIVAIAFERDTLAMERRDVLRRFSEEHKIGYLVLDGGATTDFSAALPMVDHVKGLPIEIIINRSGVVVESRNSYGYKKRWARKLEREIKKLLAEEK